MADDYGDYYSSAGQQYGVDPSWLRAMAQQESKEDPNIVSDANATGVMQLLPGTAKEMGVQDITNPQQNIHGGAKYYAQQMQKYKDPNLSLIAYNFGPTATDNWIKNGGNPEELPAETRDYVNKVNKNFAKLKPSQVAKNVTQEPAAYTQTAQVDPIEAALSDNTEKNLPNSSAIPPNVDPIEQALSSHSEESPGHADTSSLPPSMLDKADAPSEPGQHGAILDALEAAPEGLIKGFNNLPKLPGAMFTYASQLGTQGGNKLTNLIRPGTLSPERQAENIRNAAHNKGSEFLNSAPTISQIPALVQNAFTNNGVSTKELMNEPNADPLTSQVMHNPQNEISQGIENTTAALPGTMLFGVKPGAAVGGAIGAQAANNLSPDNPAAQTLGGILGGAVAPAARSLNLRATPEEVANKIIQGSQGGPPGGGGGGSNGLGAKMDLSEKVPGSKPTLAEATNDPNLAVLERQQQMKDPAAFAANEAERENARKAHFETASGTPQDVEALETQRESTSSPLYKLAENEPLNADAVKPVLANIDQAIEKVGEGSDAGKTLAKIRAKISGALPSSKAGKPSALLDAQGNPLPGAPVDKNPTQSPLIQIYREERDNLQKPATAQGAYAATVKSTIQPIVHSLGEAIEGQSPNFAKAQQIYRDISPKINAANWLQGLKLTDATGRFTLAKVKGALDNAKRMQNSPGINAAKNLTPDQMGVLQNLHDDLLRREGVARASMPRNSTTIQNEIAQRALNSGLLGKANKLMGGNIPQAAGAGAGSFLGGMFGLHSLGAIGGELLGRKLSQSVSGRAEEASGHLQNYLINPENYKNYLAGKLNDTYLSRLKGNIRN